MQNHYDADGKVPRHLIWLEKKYAIERDGVGITHVTLDALQSITDILVYR